MLAWPVSAGVQRLSVPSGNSGCTQQSPLPASKSRGGSINLRMPAMQPKNVKPKTAALLMLPALLLAACASPSMPCAPALPPRPALSQPLPASTYSHAAQMNIEAWQKLLIDTPTTPER